MCDCGFIEANTHLENMKQKAHEMGVPGGIGSRSSVLVLPGVYPVDSGDSHYAKRALSGAEWKAKVDSVRKESF